MLTFIVVQITNTSAATKRQNHTPEFLKISLFINNVSTQQNFYSSVHDEKICKRHGNSCETREVH